MKKVFIASALTLTSLLGLSIQAAYADPGQFTVTSGVDYSSGKYGTDNRTEITSVPVIGKYELDKLTLKLSVPYVTISGPGNVTPGLGKLKNSAPATQRTHESGLGDIVASATYNVMESVAFLPSIDVTGKVKFGTADEDKGLGTGENDYSIQSDFYKSYGDFTALAGIGYRVYGNTSTQNLDNVFYGSLGGTYKLAAGTTAGVIYDYRPELTDNGSKVSEATLFVNHKINQNWKAQGYAVKGFANGSPDFGIGTLVSYVF